MSDRIAFILATYDRAKKWILYVDLAVIFVLYYGSNLLPSGVRNGLLPGAIILGMAVILESLFAIQARLEAETPVIEFPDDVFGAAAKIKELLGDGKEHRLDIIAATGGSSVQAYMREVLREHQARLELHILLINPESPHVNELPRHWPREVKQTMQRLGEAAGSRHRLQFSYYEWTPCVTGVMIDRQHLFLGFFTWDAQGVIADRKDMHTYYERSPGSEKWFHVFENWHARGSPVVGLPGRVEVAAPK